MLSRLRTDPERGASAIVIAMSMLLVLGIAAIAIDLGAGWNERRQDQTTADLAAVAGALSVDNQTSLVREALTVARVNLDTVYTDAEWEAMWEGCTDPGRTPDFFPLPAPASWGGGPLDCISLSPNFVRLRVPEQETETSFGKLMGIDTLTTDAYAVVSIFDTHGKGALPFAIESGVPAGEICLDTGPAGQALPPCDGPKQGSFGNIAPPLFGNPFQGTSPDCEEQTSSNNHVPESIAMGVDHILWTYPSDSWAATGWSTSDATSQATVLASTVNMDLCVEVVVDGQTYAQAADGLLIDGVLVDTGNTVKSDITEGLISPSNFTDGDPGRLWRTGGTYTIDVMSGNSAYKLDNKPFWEFFLPSGATNDTGGTVTYSDAGNYAPASCDPANFVGPTVDDNNAKMELCLTDYDTGAPNGGTGYFGQIISDDILRSPRYGAAPQLWHDNLGSGLAYRPIEKFRNVFLAGLWFDLQSITDPEPFYPGTPGGQWCPVLKGANCAQIVEVEQLSAWLINDNMLSYTAATHYPGIDLNGLEVTIYE